jgi:hypothetical protein
MTAALKCRQRKKQWLNNLQAKAEFLSSDNERLQIQSESLKEEIVNLKTLLLAHKECPVAQANGFHSSAIQNAMPASSLLSQQPNQSRNNSAPYPSSSRNNPLQQQSGSTNSLPRFQPQRPLNSIHHLSHHQEAQSNSMMAGGANNTSASGSSGVIRF